MISSTNIVGNTGSGFAKVALLLALVLMSLSAYIRLVHSGIGCPDWPACYGRIGEPPSTQEAAVSGEAYERLIIEARQPLAWATPLHRLVASVLGLIVVFMTIVAFRSRRDRVIWLALLVLTVFLAVLGIKSGSLHNPAVIMGNLTGGFCMLGLLGWLVFKPRGQVANTSEKKLSGWTTMALVLLGSQILIGGLTSANFAATACQTFPDCQGSWLPGPALADALDLGRQHEVNAQGIVFGGAEGAAIHKTHRLVAVFTLAFLLVTSLVALGAGIQFRYVAFIIMLLVAIEFSVGVAAVVTSLPIGLAVAHNWLAALLLLSLLKLLSLSHASADTKDCLA